MPQATSKSIEVTYIPLETPADLGRSLDRALDIGYRGAVSAFKMPAGSEMWRIELNGPGNAKPVVAGVGDVFVWHSTPGFVESMTKDLFTQKYTVTGGSTATSKPEDVTYFSLETAGDLGDALNSARNISYHGKVYTEVEGPNVVWRGIELDGPGNPETVKATLGDVLVWHSPPGFLEQMSNNRFLEFYIPQ